jgi:hypothetical protein
VSQKFDREKAELPEETSSKGEIWSAHAVSWKGASLDREKTEGGKDHRPPVYIRLVLFELIAGKPESARIYHGFQVAKTHSMP